MAPWALRLVDNVLLPWQAVARPFPWRVAATADWALPAVLSFCCHRSTPPLTFVPHFVDQLVHSLYHVRRFDRPAKMRTEPLGNGLQSVLVRAGFDQVFTFGAVHGLISHVTLGFCGQSGSAHPNVKHVR